MDEIPSGFSALALLFSEDRRLLKRWHEYWQPVRQAPTSSIMKTYYLKANTHTNVHSTTQAPNGQVPPYEEIKLGIDWHADHLRVSRMIDGTPPQPAQRFTHAGFLEFAAKQLTLARNVYSCYEAGPGGYVLHRQLTQLGLTDFVVHPVNLDAQHKRAAGMPRVQPVEQSGAHAADVQEPGRAGSESYANVHGWGLL